MKWKGLITLGLVLSSFILAAFYPSINIKQKESLILNAVMNYLDVLHFKPQTIDNTFSEKAFEEFLTSVDSGKRFLTQEEIDQLAVHKSAIDDQVKMRTFPFFDAAYEIIETSRTRAENIFNEVIEEEYDLNAPGMIELDLEKRQYAQDESELKENWRKYIQFEIISKVEDAIKDQESDVEKNAVTATSDLPVEKENVEEEIKNPKTIDEMKQEAIEDIKENYAEYFERLKKERRSDFFEVYINSITKLYDPHSNYFNPKEKEDFDIRMGGKLEGIGARLQTDGDFTKVISIVPGGPAWKGKELEVNDLILSVTQKGEEPFNIKGLRIDDVVQKIRGDKGTVVILEVKKTDGTTVDIEIERDEVILDEGFAKSLTLDIPGVIENVGYIRLPKFYSEFEGSDGNSCAIDVAKELDKLKDVNVNGVILDLRNNGGGSLRDVVDMTGLFFEDGPVVQVKPRSKDAYVYGDENADVKYDGPLVVMVNQVSASASEILAAALQDYKRAVIVGSTSTFGKATVQRFVDLDRAYRDQEAFKPLGQLKITMQKFYRVDGGSTQLKGVEPDIIFPDNYYYIDYGEKDFDNALSWSEIDPVEFGQDIYVVNNIKTLQSKSSRRTADHEKFQLVLENAKRLKENRDISEFPLGLDAYTEFVDTRSEEAEKFDELYDNEVENMVVSNLPVDSTYINFDESRVARNEDWINGVQKDFYLEETLYIIKDMIELGQHDISLNKEEQQKK